MNWEESSSPGNLDTRLNIGGETTTLALVAEEEEEEEEVVVLVADSKTAGRQVMDTGELWVEFTLRTATEAWLQTPTNR